jgi:hypothetical protein
MKRLPKRPGKGDRKQVGAATRAEVAPDESSMNCGGSHTPVCVLDATQPEKPGRFFVRIAQAYGATAVKQVGVLHRRQDCEEALYPSGLRIFRCQAAAEA